MPKISFEAVVAELDHVDELIDNPSTELRIALNMVRPQNWWNSGANPETLLLISYVEGIPVAWLPRAKLVAELASAENSEARLELIMANSTEIVEDCLGALRECDDPYLRSDVNLALKAVEAFSGGHWEAGMALAVSLGEPLAKWASRPRVVSFDTEEQRASWLGHKKLMKIETDSEYQWAEWQFSGVKFDTSRITFKEKVVMAPIPRFFAPYWPDRGDVRPGWAARHVVAHDPVESQFTQRNALLSLMLVSSLLREQQSWCESIREVEIDAEWQANL